MHSGRNIIYECCVSQSVLHEVLHAVSDDAFKRKCLFNGEIMFHSAFKKDTEKAVLGIKLEVKGLIKIIKKFKAEKTLCTFLSHHQTSFEGYGISITKTIVLI